MPAGLSRESRLVRGDSGWNVRDAEGTVQARFGDDEVRITVSWKADIFADAAEAERHDRGDDPLTLDAVVRVFQKDLAAGGMDVRLPSNPLADQEWIGLLASTYRDPAPAL
jgi:hypothetical protein